MAIHDPRLPAGRGFSAEDEIIIIDVGEPTTMMFVHCSVLCSSADFFKTRMKPEWSGTDAAHIKLPQYTPAAFNIYVNWLYAGGVPATAQDLGDETIHDKEWTNLAAAFVVGEGVMDVAFKDVVMDALRAKVRSAEGATIWRVACDMVKIIYDGTTVGSPARKFMVDIFYHHGDPSVLCGPADDLQRDFLLDLGHDFMTARTAPPVAMLGG